MHDQAACYRAKVYTAETEAVIFLNDLSLHRPCHGDLLLLDIRFQSLFKGSKGSAPARQLLTLAEQVCA